MKISTGELDGTKAFMKKLFKVEGDMNLVLKLNKIFSESDSQEARSREIQKPFKNLERIPDHRGPIKLNGMQWLNIAFIPSAYRDSRSQKRWRFMNLVVRLLNNRL